MKKIYYVILGRNKSGVKGTSVNVRKRKLYNGICSRCSRPLNITQLHLEHTLPVCVGGRVFDIKNNTVMCYKCHTEKTILDKRTINILKKIGYIKKNGVDMLFFLHPKEIEKLFHEIKYYLLDAETTTKIYDEGKGGIDYKYIIWNGNREVKT